MCVSMCMYVYVCMCKKRELAFVASDIGGGIIGVIGIMYVCAHVCLCECVYVNVYMCV